MEDVIMKVFNQAYLQKCIETENWVRTNAADGFEFFEKLNISSDVDYIDNALLYVKKNSTELLKRCDATSKSNKESQKVREKANDFFKEKKYLQAVKSYSKSIALAENGSNELAFAYANRSALLLHRGYYKECLEDIQRALRFDYPQDKRPQLITRQEKAKGLLPSQNKNYSPDELPVLQDRNPFLNGASNSIKVSENEKCGRFIEATKDIRPGEVIVIEDPFVIVVGQEHKTTHCGDCGKLCFNPIPCSSCSIEMYCSNKCRDSAYETYHQYECLVMQFYPKKVFDVESIPPKERDISEINKDLIQQLTLRITLKGFKTYQSSSPGVSGKMYEEVGKLQTHLRDMNKSSLMIVAINCAKQFHILKKHTNLFSKLHFKDREVILKYHLLRNRLICCFNLGTIQYRLDDLEDGNTTVGLGIFPTYNMFNHACSENTAHGFYGKTKVIRAISTIKKGEQCFANYGHFFHQDPKIVRQVQLQYYYLFKCDCVACEQDWPVLDEKALLQKAIPSLYMELQLLKTVFLEEKNPNEEFRQKMFETCREAERNIKGDKFNLGLVLYVCLACAITITRFKGNSF